MKFEGIVDEVRADHANGLARRQNEVLEAMGFELDERGNVVSVPEDRDTGRDTTLLIGHTRGEDAVGDYLVEHESETLIVSAISLQEIAVGEVVARDASKAEVQGYVGAFDVRPFTDDHAYHAAAIEADLRVTGAYDRNLARDVLIGGVARSLSAPVVTRNVNHFETFDGVRVETY